MFDLFGMIREKGVNMISKELLNEVLEDEVVHIYDKSDMGENYICYMPKLGCNVDINIYELAHKCKEWAFNNGYSIVDGIDTIGEQVCYLMKCTGYSVDYYYEQTKDYKDVFKACQWILDNKED